MLIQTPTGDLHEVRERAWPLAGLNGPRTTYGVDNTNPLLRLVGDDQYATLVRLYKENPWLNAGVRAIAWGLARADLATYNRLPGDQRERVRWDAVTPGRNSAAATLDRRLNAPVGRIGPQRRMRATMVDYLLRGNALWDISQPEGVWHVPWRHIEVIEGDREPIIGYRIKGATRDRFLAPEDVVHFSTGDDPDSVIGISPLVSLRHTLALHDALQRHIVKFFENSARPSGNLRVSNPNASPDLLDRLRDQINELYASPENAGKIIVTTGDFQAITASADQSQIIELARLSREEIAGVLRIPGPVLGFLEHAIKSNVKELREQYVRDTIGGWAPAVVDDIMSQMVNPVPSLRQTYVEFELEAQLEPDTEGKAAVNVQMERTMTLNERRRKWGLPDLDYPEANTVPTVPGGSYLGIEPELPKGDVADTATGGEDNAPNHGNDKVSSKSQGKLPRDADLDGVRDEPK